MVAHWVVRMQVPSTPLTSHVAGGAPLDEVELDDELLLDVDDEVLVEVDDEELELEPLGVQHSMLAAPGQYPGVDAYPPFEAQTDVSMHVPATPATVHAVGGAPPSPAPPWPPAKSSRSAREPLNLSRSGALPTPGTVPVSAFCQKRQLLHEAVGTLG